MNTQQVNDGKIPRNGTISARVPVSKFPDVPSAWTIFVAKFDVMATVRFWPAHTLVKESFSFSRTGLRHANELEFVGET